jgi:aminoglycoside phosphotransferase (APT) family kinase protein
MRVMDEHAQVGRRIGVGRTAEVFAEDDRAIKVFRAGMPDIVGEHEARVAGVVDAVGIGAPGFHGSRRVDGRLALVYQRLEGPSMLERLGHHPLEVDSLARTLADLHLRMHLADGTGLDDQRDAMRHLIERGAVLLAPGSRDRVLARLDSLPSGAAICHGDFHPGNVLLTRTGPAVIDWAGATRGQPAADVARTLFLLRDSALPGHLPVPERMVAWMIRRRFARTYLARYRRGRRMSDAAIAAWRLPVLAARLGEDIPEETARLIGWITDELAFGSDRH